MKTQIDSGIPDVLGDEDLTEVTPDAFTKILAASPLAAHIGFDQAERFNASTAQRDRKFADHYKNLAQTATAKNSPTQPEAAGGDTLEKIFNPRARRKASLTNYLRKMLAQGETAQGVIEHAQKHDPETANLFREIAREIEAA